MFMFVVTMGVFFLATKALTTFVIFAGVIVWKIGFDILGVDHDSPI